MGYWIQRIDMLQHQKKLKYMKRVQGMEKNSNERSKVLKICSEKSFETAACEAGGSGTLMILLLRGMSELLIKKKKEKELKICSGGSSSSEGRNTSKVAEEKVVVGFTEEVETVMGKLLDSREGGQLEIIPIVGAAGGGGSSSSEGRNTSKVAEEKVVVGFTEEVETVMGKLLDSREGGQLEIIPIVGAAGGGKTTLAIDVYNHPLISHSFEIRAWVNISQDYNKTEEEFVDWFSTRVPRQVK